MSAFLGVPVDAAYHVVSALASFLAPLPWGLAAAAAIVGFTLAVRLLLAPLSYRAMRGMDAQARMAPRVQALQKQHAGQPDRLQRELAALYRAEGTTMFAGCLPALAQWPVLSVVYLLFRSPRVGGAPNTLLAHGLLGAPLDSHWLGGAGPFSTQGAVFAGLFVLLAGIGWLSARLARRATPPAGPAPAGPARPSTARPSTGRPGFAAPAALAAVVPFATVAVAALVPLAAGLYLLTTTAWTLAERALARRLAERALARRALAARPAGADRAGAQ
jgi:YidC/Oxa1 family membrane protein insertase